MHLLRIDPYVANEGYVVRVPHNRFYERLVVPILPK